MCLIVPFSLSLLSSVFLPSSFCFSPSLALVFLAVPKTVLHQRHYNQEQPWYSWVQHTHTYEGLRVKTKGGGISDGELGGREADEEEKGADARAAAKEKESCCYSRARTGPASAPGGVAFGRGGGGRPARPRRPRSRLTFQVRASSFSPSGSGASQKSFFPR